MRRKDQIKADMLVRRAERAIIAQSQLCRKLTHERTVDGTHSEKSASWTAYTATHSMHYSLPPRTACSFPKFGRFIGHYGFVSFTEQRLLREYPAFWLGSFAKGNIRTAEPQTCANRPGLAGASPRPKYKFGREPRSDRCIGRFGSETGAAGLGGNYKGETHWLKPSIALGAG